MKVIDSPQPADHENIIREHFCPPSLCKSEKGVEKWPINHMARDPYTEAWGHILAIERGWFAHDRSGFLGWTKVGRDQFPEMRREERPPAPKPEPQVEAPEPKAALADEIGSRADGKPRELTMFWTTGSILA